MRSRKITDKKSMYQDISRTGTDENILFKNKMKKVFLNSKLLFFNNISKKN